jgi:hypothetical protein
MAEVVDSIIAELIARDNGYIETFDKATAAHGRFKASVDKLKVQTFDLAAEGRKYKTGADTIARAEEEVTQRTTRTRKVRTDAVLASDKAIAASAKVTADKQIAEAERAARLSVVAQRAVDRQRAGLAQGTGALFGSSVPAGGSFVPPSVVPAATTEEVVAEKEINHLLADQATLQASLTVARGRDRDIIRDQITEMRLFNSLVRAGYTEEEATLQVEKRMLAIEAERVRIAEKQALTDVGNFAKGAGLGRLGGGTAAIAGIATVAGVAIGAQVVENAIEYGKALQNVSSQLGINTTALQVYERAAIQAGASQEQFVTGLGQLQAYLGRAQDGDEGAAKTFAALGVSITKATSAGELLPTLIDRISSIADPAQRAAIETRLFGEEGRKLDTMLAGGNAKINDLAEALERTGAILSSGEIQQLDDTARKYAELKAELEVDLARIVAGNADAIRSLANAFAFLADHIGGAIQKASQFAKAGSFGHPDIMKYSAVPMLAGVVGAAYGAVVGSDPVATPGGAKALGAATPGKVDSAALAKLFAPKPPKGKSAETLAREEAARQKRFTDQMARLDDQQLQARQDTTSDEQERSAIEIERINRERKAALDDIRTNVDFSAAQKKKLAAAQNAASDAQIAVVDARDRVSDIKRQAAADSLILDQKDNELRAAEDLATTVAERRRIELQLLANDQERQRIANQSVLDRAKAGDSSLNPQDIATARSNLKNQPAQAAAATASINARNRGPLADYLAQLPASADQVSEALQRVQVDGIQSITDGLADAASGAKSLASVFHDVAHQIIADLARIAIEKAIAFGVQAISGSPSLLSNSQASSWATANANFATAHRASGGNVVSGTPYMVGENGPELFVPPISGSVSPNQSLKAGGQSGGNSTVKHVIAIDPSPLFTTSVRQEAQGAAITVIAQVAPSIVGAAKSATLMEATRQRLPQSAG